MASAGLVKAIQRSLNDNPGQLVEAETLPLAICVANAVEAHRGRADLHYLITLEWERADGSRGLGSWNGLVKDAPDDVSDQRVFERVYQMAVDKAREQDPDMTGKDPAVLCYRVGRDSRCAAAGGGVAQ
jgi:hypothetical protein